MIHDLFNRQADHRVDVECIGAFLLRIGSQECRRDFLCLISVCVPQTAVNLLCAPRILIVGLCFLHLHDIGEIRPLRPIRTNEERNVLSCVSKAVRSHGMRRHKVAINHRLPAHTIACSECLWNLEFLPCLFECLIRCCREMLIGNGLNLLNAFCRNAEFFQRQLRHTRRRFFWHEYRSHGRSRTAFDDALVEQPLCIGCRHQCEYFCTAARLTENRDVCRITAELCDVVPHPAQRVNEVIDTDIVRIAVFLPIGGEVEMSEHIQTMINGNNDNVALTAEIGTVIGGNLSRRTCGEPAAMQPDHDGAFLAVRDAGCPDVEILAVVVHRELTRGVFPCRIQKTALFLRRNRSVVKRETYPLPRRYALGADETLLCLGIGNAVIGVDALAHIALHQTALGRCHSNAGSCEEIALLHANRICLHSICGKYLPLGKGQAHEQTERKQRQERLFCSCCFHSLFSFLRNHSGTIASYSAVGKSYHVTS